MGPSETRAVQDTLLRDPRDPGALRPRAARNPRLQLTQVQSRDRSQSAWSAALSRLRELPGGVDTGRLLDDHGEQHYPDRRNHRRCVYHRRDERLCEGPAGPAWYRRGLALPVEHSASDEHAVRSDLDLLG